MNNITLKSLEEFLYAVDKLFPIPLSEKTNLHEFARKLIDRATIFYETDGEKIISLVAGYIDNAFDGIGYISIVATLPEMRRRGIAKKLITEFLNTAYKNGLSAVHLYTDKANKNALKLYDSFGFESYKLKNELRPADVHLIVRFRSVKK